KSVGHVRRNLVNIAAALALPTNRLYIEEGEHPGRIKMWVADRDPFDGNRKESHPLLDQPHWSVFDGAPYGTDNRGRGITVPLVNTYWLVGGRQGAGKTGAIRSLLTGAVLDPYVKLHIFDGKSGRQYRSLRYIATSIHIGDIDEQAEALAELLVELRDDGRR